ncbi:MAG: GPR endopeptidase [Clostridia bacterium]|nr:GPR endopeptidase [Clostridia bacterium]
MQNIRTDLALEAHEMSKKNAQINEQLDGVEAIVTEHGHITMTKVKITNENGSKKLGKAIGNYITIEAPDLKYDTDEYERVCKIVAEEIEKMAPLQDNSLTLVVGLGNRDITPDALGTEVISKLMVTRHIKNNIAGFEKINEVCAVVPGVLGTTGIETLEIIKGIVQRVKPSLIIAVDALAAADIRRISTTIQISDTGIQPGAGVGNNREGLNKESLGVKVIAIGVPTVIDASTISKVEIPEELAPLMVTTKDIDLVIERMAKTVANGINMALHKGWSLMEIESFLG